MAENHDIFTDYANRSIRLTSERWQHILVHAEMLTQRERIKETLSQPDVVVKTQKADDVHIYQRFYERTPVTQKYLTVAVKMLPDNAFILTAFFTNRTKRGKVIYENLV